jgi:hypothetical protein
MSVRPEFVATQRRKAMLRRFPAFLVLGVLCGVAIPAAAQETAEEPSGDPASGPTGSDAPQSAPAASEGPQSASNPQAPSEEQAAATAGPPAIARTDEPASSDSREPAVAAADAPSPVEPSPVEQRGWNTFVSGYFRAPMAIGISTRPGPDDKNGPAHTQLSYGPNRTVDANYYSFGYTRLQEQDWAEVFIHAKKKHVEAVVGWMGYWYQAAGFRNNDAAWAPGLAYLTLDTDFELGGLKPHVALTGGAWWPKFGYFEKYDTYTLGQMRQLGEQIRLTIPVNPDLKLTLVQGFGSVRSGIFSITSQPPYQSTVGLNLLHYEHVQLTYKDYLDVALHYNSQWTRDPNLTQQVIPGTAYGDARKAYFTTFGGELTLKAPYAGRLWVSPSLTRVRNGWALGQAGVELMHAVSGEGFATTYLAWDESARNSTGSGSSFNLGFLYENTLSNILGRPAGTLPEVTLNAFGLLADVKLDLPDSSVLTQDRITQFKYGADVTLQALDWVGFMLRWDEVNYDLDHPGYAFSAITPRVTFSSHFLSGESIYIQYSRYRYGDHMVLAGKWPWGLPLSDGSDLIQGGIYAGKKPDMDVVKVQATVAF